MSPENKALIARVRNGQPGYNIFPADIEDIIQAARAEERGILADANAVHLNMLRGGIAKLTPAHIGHLYRGDEAVAVVSEVKRQNPDAFEERGKGPTREEVAEACWYRLNNDRHGGPWYLGAKPTDSHAMRDTFAFADAILALFQKDKRNEG